MGKGAFDGKNPAYTGMIGMHGTKTSNFGVSECDLLIALGARFSDRVIGNAKKFASNAKILHIDIDAAEINKNIHTDASIVGDLKTILKELNKRQGNCLYRRWTASDVGSSILSVYRTSYFPVIRRTWNYGLRIGCMYRCQDGQAR